MRNYARKSSPSRRIEVGRWDTGPVVLNLATGPIKQVDDFKYLGSWLRDSTKDFRVWDALAWKACTRLVKIWKSKLVTRAVKLKLFLACVESTSTLLRRLSTVGTL